MDETSTTSTTTRPAAPAATTATTAPAEPGLARELGSSALLLGLSFAVTAVVVTSAQAAAALLGT